MREIDRIIIHCSDSPQNRGDTVADIDLWHKQRGFKRVHKGVTYHVGYHYVILENGFVEVGRPIEVSGAHAVGHNNSSIGICLIGIDSFTDKQFESLKHLVNGLMENYDIMPNKVLGHYQVDKHGKTCPNFDVPKFIGTIGD